MKCPKCHFEQPDDHSECMRCGIIFEKYSARIRLSADAKEEKTPESPATQDLKEGRSSLQWVKELLFSVDAEVNLFYFGGRIAVYLVLVIWGIVLVSKSIESNYVGMSFLHYINLPFHEAGHIIFKPFGRFISVLGGSLGQLLIPLIVMGTFLFKNRNAFGASVGVWWLGENFMDLAPYINDARALKLILLGGVTGREVADYHDWEYLLRILGWKQYDHAIASLSYTVGITLMILALLWGGYILYKQFQNIDW